MYRLKIDFTWTSLPGKILVVGQPPITGLFYGWKAKARFKKEAEKEQYHKAEIKKTSSKVTWIFEDKDLVKLKKEEDVFNKELLEVVRSKSKNAMINTLINLKKWHPLKIFKEQFGIIIWFTYYKNKEEIKDVQKEIKELERIHGQETMA
jgi:actin-related protein